MKQLSKAKRHAIYLKATHGYKPKPKKDVNDTTPYCLCYNFARIIQKKVSPHTSMYRDLTTMLPEFGMFNPFEEYSFNRWWHDERSEWSGGDEERYFALAMMIAMSK